MADFIKVKDKQAFKVALGSQLDEVVVGKETDSLTFTPQIKFTKWGKEESFTLKVPDGLIANTVPNLLSKELSIGDDKTGFYFNPQDASLKFGLLFKSLPKATVINLDGVDQYRWQFELEGWDSFNFFYSVPFKNVDAEGNSYDGYDETSPWLHHATRFTPAEMSGGYEIFHKTKRDHIMGQRNYGIGKIGDFHRPKFIDSGGKWVWGILHIQDGIYSIFCPKAFLDSAVYPVRVNDEYGYTTLGASSGWEGSNTTTYMEMNANAPDGTLNYIHVGCTPQDISALDFKHAVYTESSNAPNTRVCLDASAWSTGSTTKAFYSNPVDFNFTLVKDVHYWGAHHNINFGFAPAYTAGGGLEIRYQSGTPPATASSSGDYSNITPSVHFSYTPAAGGGSIPGNPFRKPFVRPFGGVL